MRETVVVVSGRRTWMMRVAADSLTEQEATRQLFLAAGGLVLLGVVLLIATIVWWRSTRPEPSALAPLEVMSTRRWEKASEAERRRLADAVRPHGPHPAPERSDPLPLDLGRTADEEAEADRFDDLREIDELLSALTGAGSDVAPEVDAASVPAAGTADAAAGAAATDEPAVPTDEPAVPTDEPAVPTDDSALPADDTVLQFDDEPAANVDGDVAVEANAQDGDDPEHVDAAGSDDHTDDGADDGTTMIAIDPLLRLSQTD